MIGAPYRIDLPEIDKDQSGIIFYKAHRGTDAFIIFFGECDLYTQERWYWQGPALRC